jgi:nucleoside-diphosphate-sugar epimerase
MKQISILGCGWLGLPLAKSLIEKGFSVKGSTTTLEKMSVLENARIIPFLVSLSAVEVCDETKSSIEQFLNHSEILIINIPPKLRGNSKDTSTALSMTFVAKIQNLIPFIEKSGVKKVIFVSSTSVYGDLPFDCAQGDKISVTELTTPNPDTESGKQLLTAENLLQNNPNFATTIVRFGGLIGEDRHPIHFLAGRQHIENPDAPINLIHQTDCIGIIQSIIQQNCFGVTFNAVAPYHPTRKEYYTQKALALGLPLPEFDESRKSVGKTMVSTKIETLLTYPFQNKTL